MPYSTCLTLLRKTMTLLKWQCVSQILLLLHFIVIVSTQTGSQAPCPYNATEVVPPVQSLQDWNYLGCYRDDDKRVLNSTMYWGPGNNTVTGCANFCGGYAFFGVELGAQCFCGVSLRAAANTKLASDTLCNYTCCADRTISCGGLWYLNIYEAIEPSPTLSTTVTSPSPTQASSAGSGGQSDGVNQGNGNSNASNKISLGVGLGFGVPMFVLAAVTLGLKCSSRRKERIADMATLSISRTATQESSVDIDLEPDSVTALQSQKLNRFA